MGIIHVYYHFDVDGIVAAGILYNHFGRPDNMEFYMIDYSVKLNFDHIDFEIGDQVYFLDYSFSNKENLEEFKKLLDRRSYYNSVIWIDHHKNSVEDLSKFNEVYVPGIRSKELCGAALTYVFLKNFEKAVFSFKGTMSPSVKFHNSVVIPKFLKYIDDYDCWKHIYDETNAFHYGFLIDSPKALDIRWLLINKGPNKMIDDIIKTGNSIMNYLEFNDKVYHIDMHGFEYTLPEEHGGIKCFCLNRKGNSLMFGDKIDEYDAVIPFYYNGKNWTHSIFTNKDYVDCCKIAKTYGGAGHLKAADWVSDVPFFENVFILDTLQQPKELNEYAIEPIFENDRYYCPSCYRLQFLPHDKIQVGTISKCICGQKLDYSKYKPDEEVYK